MGGVSVVLACRAADVDGITPIPQLLAFLPWLLIPVTVALALAALARWRLGVVWALVVAVGTGWFTQPYGDGANRPEGPALAKVRVLTSNVEFGWATSELSATIRREKPDIVFAEECDSPCSAALRGEFAAEYPYTRVVEAHGPEGSALLSRYPLKDAPGIAATLGMPGAVAEIAGRPVQLQLAHPMPPRPGGIGLWRTELGALRDYAADRAGVPTILAGDFNASQDHAAFRRILDTGLHDSARLAGDSRAPSWPSATAPPLGTQIDHVLVSRDFSVGSARFLDLANTDHRSLLAELTLHGAGPG
ncbi:endonuclease/exonuclease/phosphatase family protein [Streptomyces sp. NBC_01304]|nr:endonuclease/exonuclease/phosphatase family protein [Streptomyces sp. NBC_01304]